jgi:flagellar hook protein FlgE
MSIIGSMYNASSALDSFGTSMQVVGHNIANLNTAGFKASRVIFADVLPSIYGEMEAGNGVYALSADRQFTQGAFESTDNATDLAIGGNGFFVVRDNAGAAYYTRAGQFHLDEAYNLVNLEGYLLQGAAGNISLAAQQTLAAQATTTLEMSFNLDSAATTPAVPFPAGDADPSSWINASNASMVATLYDSQGAAHHLTFLFRKSTPNNWEYRVVGERSEMDATVPNSTDLRELGSGTVTFNDDGSFASSTSTGINIMTWVNGAAAQTIGAANVVFGQPATAATPATGATQYAEASALNNLVQDGRPQGDLRSIAIDAQGNVRGLYSNGESRLIDTVQLAHFANTDALDPFGDTLFLETTESGPAQMGSAGSGGRGDIASGTLELSTVDLAAEFVTMLASQRAFQMNSRVITTAERMYSIAAELKA